MSEIKNYKMNFSSGRPQCGPSLPNPLLHKLAFSEIHRLQFVVGSSLGCVGVGSDV
jgi:hypothetical protein